MKRLLLAVAITALAPVEAEAALKGAALARQAKVSLNVARAKALRARPGRITDHELERERGGSGLRYSFDIVSRRHTYEVGIDAITGAVLENTREGTHPD